MYDSLKPARKVAALVGFGVLSGSLPDGQLIVYRGGTQRFTPHEGETADPAFRKALYLREGGILV